MKQIRSTMVMGAAVLAVALTTGCTSSKEPATQPANELANSAAQVQAGSETPAPADQPIAVPTQRQSAPGFGEILTFLIEDVLQKKPAIWARQMQDPNFADERRIGMTNLVTRRQWARKSPFTDRYRQIAVLDTDYTVQSAALRALNIARDPQATPIFIRALSNTERTVRIEGAKGLNNVPDPAATSALLQLTRDTDRDVRIAAVEALRHYKTNEVARTLVGLLRDRDFGVVWQARQTLILLTGSDYLYDETRWQSHLASTPLT